MTSIVVVGFKTSPSLPAHRVQVKRLCEFQETIDCSSYFVCNCQLDKLHDSDQQNHYHPPISKPHKVAVNGIGLTPIKTTTIRLYMLLCFRSKCALQKPKLWPTSHPPPTITSLLSKPSVNQPHRLSDSAI